MKNLLVVCLLCITAFACKNKSTAADPRITKADTTRFYPIASFIRGQLNLFESTKAIYVCVTIAGEKKDSVVINKQEAYKLAKAFIDADISDSLHKINYKESVFHDAGTGSYNINYTAFNLTDTVQNIDILMDEQTSLIKRLFIRKQYLQEDARIIEQLNWKANEGFSQIISNRAASGSATNKTTTVRVILK